MSYSSYTSLVPSPAPAPAPAPAPSVLAGSETDAYVDKGFVVVMLLLALPVLRFLLMRARTCCFMEGFFKQQLSF